MRKIIRGVILAVAIGFILSLAINIYVIESAKKYIYSEQELPGRSFDCALILGAKVYPSGALSPMLKDRVQTGVDLYRRGIVSILLMSGDYENKKYNEVGSMKNFALEQGVLAKDIAIDPAGFSTYESMYRAKAVFLVANTVIVTQKYHVYRAVYIARVLGIDAYGVYCGP